MSDRIFHVVFGKAAAACRWTLELDVSQARFADRVPVARRCQHPKCAEAWQSDGLAVHAAPVRSRVRTKTALG